MTPLNDQPRPDKMRAFDKALEKLRRLDARAAHILGLKLYLSVTDEEIAEFTGAGVRTVKRDLRAAKPWLRSELDLYSAL